MYDVFIISDVAAIQEMLVQQYEGATRSIPVMPLEDDEGVSLSNIYGSVLVEEDLTATKKTRKPDEKSGHKALDSMKDMFYVNYNLAKRIFLKGEAGHGKTVFCLKAIELWSRSKSSNESLNKENSTFIEPPQHEQTEFQQSQNEHTQSKQSIAMQTDDEKDLGNCLSQFDLVFYVPLRYATHDESSIVDLVCDSISGCEKSEKEKIKQMLGDGRISCLVLLDGLDEWRAPLRCRVQGFPDSDDLVNCTVLCTMRPWRMVNLQLGLDNMHDKVVQILGLKGTSVEAVISNVLIHFYGLEVSSPLYEKQLERFCLYAKLPLLESLMKIPLMLSAACLIWSEEDDISMENFNKEQYFMTFFYLKLIELMISRAEIKNTSVSSFLSRKRESSNITLPSILSEFSHIVDFFDVITPVGKLALKDLVSEETHLVFPKYKLERDIGQTLVEHALKTGILTQAKAPGLSYQQRVSVNFFHKSIQEFMAALVLSCGEEEALNLFCIHCRPISKVMELSNMIMFVCGLNPAFGTRLSEHVKFVMNTDADIIQYRDALVKTDMNFDISEGKEKVRELYKMQSRFFTEMKSSLAHTRDKKDSQNVHAPDLYLDMKSGFEEIDMTKELVGVENNEILSVCLRWGNHKNRDDIHIMQHLPNCKNLASLLIGRNSMSNYTVVLQHTLQKLIQLKCLQLRDIYLTDTVALNDIPKLQTVTLTLLKPEHLILPSLWLCSQLKHVKLGYITLSDSVTLQNMPLLDTLALQRVRCAHFMLISLPGCANLTSLDIVSLRSMKDRVVLARVLPRLIHLQHIKYHVVTPQRERYDFAGDVAVVIALKQLSELQSIEIEGISYTSRYEGSSAEEEDCDCDITKVQINGVFAPDSEEDRENNDDHGSMGEEDMYARASCSAGEQTEQKHSSLLETGEHTENNDDPACMVEEDMYARASLSAGEQTEQKHSSLLETGEHTENNDDHGRMGEEDMYARASCIAGEQTEQKHSSLLETGEHTENNDDHGSMGEEDMYARASLSAGEQTEQMHSSLLETGEHTENNDDPACMVEEDMYARASLSAGEQTEQMHSSLLETGEHTENNDEHGSMGEEDMYARASCIAGEQTEQKHSSLLETGEHTENNDDHGSMGEEDMYARASCSAGEQREQMHSSLLVASSMEGDRQSVDSEVMSNLFRVNADMFADEDAHDTEQLEVDLEPYQWYASGGAHQWMFKNADMNIDDSDSSSNGDSDYDQDKERYGIDNEQICRWFNSNSDENIENDGFEPFPQVTPNMKKLEKLKLKTIQMSRRGWSVFVNSLLSVQHNVHVELDEIDIDTETTSMIQMSPHFKVLNHNSFLTRTYDMTFCRLPTPIPLVLLLNQHQTGRH